MPAALPRPDGPVVLCILDGVGLGDGGPFDAVASAPTPTLDRLWATCPHLSLQAHGTAVGLPTDGDMGNSEVGHNALGAGRVFDQGAKLVDKALRSGAAFDTDLWSQLTAQRTLHLLGLVSDGNVHSHVDHLHLLIDRAVADGVTRLRVHVLTDGRDVDARSALTWVEPLEARLAELREQGVDAAVASGGGRMHLTMDRYEADWPMVARGWAVHVRGEGRAFASASEAIRTLYEEDPEVDDQYLPGFVITGDDGAPCGPITDGDAVLMFNFRGDRAIEISRAFDEPDLSTFDRGPVPDVLYAGMMEYDGDLQVPKHYLVQPPEITRPVGQLLAEAGRTTLAVSETQKFGHVTYFFNGNRSGAFDDQLETYVQIPSDVRPFDEAPWMKAAEITDVVLEALAAGEVDHIRCNLANGDMVGHTGALQATRVALSCLDLQLARLERAIRKHGGVLLITADHGNADQMVQLDAEGQPRRDAQGEPIVRTSHSLNPVPFIVVDPSGQLDVVDDLGHPGLASVGTTLLDLLGVPIPADWCPTLVRARPEAGQG